MPVTLSDADYQRLFDAVAADDDIAICDHCGAWLDRSDPRFLDVGDVQGCAWSVLMRDQDKDTCVKDAHPPRPAI